MNGTRFLLADHALFRAFHKGTVGILEATGAEDPNVYSGQTGAMRPYRARPLPAAPAAAAAGAAVEQALARTG